MGRSVLQGSENHPRQHSMATEEEVEVCASARATEAPVRTSSAAAMRVTKRMITPVIIGATGESTES